MAANLADWERIETLFQAAVELPAAARPQFLDDVCKGDAALREEVDSLLAADADNGEAINAAVQKEAHSFFSIEEMAGTRVGPYLVIRELGRGGMGSVYLAERDDDQFHKEVAIKFIRHGMDTEDVLGRFRHERQILANLEHPYIARLLDGGTTRDGRPFFVMEYVIGQPLDVWCSKHEPIEIRQRCELFLKICEAVSHAHRNLVVHRDLKPANIFVTADGSPKLLDFGVAKLLDQESAFKETATILAARALTPDYASPEQIRAEHITTATDVYSLGAIFYELLSGVRAQRFTTPGTREIERVVCETDPPRLADTAPPALRSKLQGDLDAIVSMALRKEQALRYQSVEQMAADLRRHLNGWPVKAREGTFRYQAGKYLRRNRTAIAAGTILAVALVGGATTAGVLAVRASQARAQAETERRRAVENELRAEASERDAQNESREAARQRTNAEAQRREAELQRTLAETQSKLAERRFDQVHQLAGKFLLDFHNAIAMLPGSTPARKMVVQTGLQYYDMLVRDAGGNRQLLEEVARGYDRLGDVQGNPYFANLGDAPGALASYRRALAIREKVTDPSAEFLRDRIHGHIKIAQMLVAQGDFQGAEKTYQQVFLFAGPEPAASDYDVRDALASAYSSYGDLKIRVGVHGEAVAPYLKLLELQTQLSKEKRNVSKEQNSLSLAHTKLGDVYVRLDRAGEAQEHLKISLAIDKPLSEANPSNLPLARKLWITYTMLGRALHTRGGPRPEDPSVATGYLQSAVDLADKMAAADINNQQPLADVLMAGTGLGDWLVESGSPQPAIAAYRKGLTAAERIYAIRPTGNEDFMIQAHQRLASGLTGGAQYDEALQHLDQANHYLELADKQNPGLARTAARHGDIMESKAVLFAARKQWDEAIAAYIALISIFDSQIKRDPNNQRFLNEQPAFYNSLADCYEAAGQRQSAVKALENALARYSQIEEHRALGNNEKQERAGYLTKLSAWQH